MSKNVVTLKSASEVTQGHWNYHLPSNLLPHYLAKSKCSTIQLRIICLCQEAAISWVFHLLIYFSSWRWYHYDIIGTFLLHYSCLSIMKIFSWHSTEQCTTDASMTSGVHDSKHTDVPKADILNTR